MAKPKGTPLSTPKKTGRITKKMYEELQIENDRLRATVENYRKVNASQLSRLVGEELFNIQVRELKAKIAILEEKLVKKDS